MFREIVLQWPWDIFFVYPNTKFRILITVSILQNLEEGMKRDEKEEKMDVAVRFPGSSGMSDGFLCEYRVCLYTVRGADPKVRTKNGFRRRQASL